MKEHEAGGDVTRKDSTGGEVGDVEAAGETTAASAINGPVDERPVGAETMVKVADAPNQSESKN
jgi:hypothetical protein